MIKRDLIGSLDELVGQEVQVAGWIDTVRDLKNIQFLVLRDHTGYVQATNFKQGRPLDDLVSNTPPESTVIANGKLVDNPGVDLHGYEIQLDNLDVQTKPHGLKPITPDSGLDKRLDWRYIDLRQPEKNLIFKVQTTMEHAMREYWMENGFTEIHSPKLISGASESGAELFTMDYFGQEAALAQSPQFYKQMAMAAGFDRVFEIGPVFRANKSHTSRHDTEFTMIDKEVSWIDSHEDIMDIESQWFNYVIGEVADKHGEQIYDAFGVEVKAPNLPFPQVTLQEAHNLLEHKMNYQVPKKDKGDLDPKGERLLAQYVKEQQDHDFVFVTDYPAKARPFYHMRQADNPDLTKSFDLIWKGIEVTTGAQREHRYDTLMDQIHEKNIDVKGLGSYPDFFKHGMPPHGGCGIGLTRMLMNITEIPNVRDVTFVYRGVNRLTP